MKTYKYDLGGDTVLALKLFNGEDADLILLPASSDKDDVPCLVFANMEHNVYVDTGSSWSNIDRKDLLEGLQNAKEVEKFLKNDEYNLYLKLKAKYEKD